MTTHPQADPTPGPAGSVGGAGPLPPTPSQTVGPFYGFALPYPGGGDLAPADHPDAVTVHGVVLDGAGAPVPDALLELWQPDPAGSLAGAPGSLRRNGVDFTGFGRVATDAAGHWVARTLRPGARPGRRPYLSVCVFARGLLRHLYTRLYLPDPPGDEEPPTDPLLDALPPTRRRTLLAVAESPARYRFDIRLQGEGETVFFDFPADTADDQGGREAPAGGRP